MMQRQPMVMLPFTRQHGMAPVRCGTVKTQLDHMWAVEITPGATFPAEGDCGQKPHCVLVRLGRF